MSIKKYTNFESIDVNASNQGEFLQENDKFIINQNQIQDTDFGDCKHDVMEISVYDVNNNLLPNKNGNNVAYIKTGDIKNYLYNLTNKGGQNELAIDIEKLLNDLGFTNGILKVNINFVRNKVGSENQLTKVWIQEISPSREEVRILPLVTTDDNINKKTSKEFRNVNNLSKDFKYYKKNILDALDSFESNYLDSITNLMVNKFGKDFQSILRKDFGLSNFDGFKKRIFSDFKTSITYWVNNRYYDVSQSNFGKPSDIRFEECEQYSFQTLLDEIQIILRNCIEYHTKTLKRRDITIKALPKEFEITQLKKDVKDLVGNININENRVRNVYNPANVDLKVTGTKTINPPVQIIPTPEIKIQPIELPIIKIEPTPQPIKPIESTPILVIEPTPEPKVEPIQDVIPTPSIGGGGGSVRTFEDPRQNDSGLYDYGRNISDRGRVEEYT
jgi:hypothetical protein